VIWQYVWGYCNFLIFVKTCLTKYGLFWRKFHGLLRRMYLFLLQGGILSLVHLIDGVIQFIRFFVNFYCLDDLSIGDWVTLKSPTVIVLGSVCIFMYSSICLMKLAAPTLGAYRLTIVISSLYIAPAISMRWPFSLVTNFDLKCTLSDTSIAIPACFWGPLAWLIFFYPFSHGQCLFLSIR
jgi:hypothetical protein